MDGIDNFLKQKGMLRYYSSASTNHNAVKFFPWRCVWDRAKQITPDLPVIVCVCNSGYNYEVNDLCIDIDVVTESDKLKLDRAKLQQFDNTE